MEIGDIVTDQDIISGWLQFVEEEKGFVKYMRDGDAFLFKKIGENKYQLQDIQVLRSDFAYHT
jgi:hypothetical protein